MCGLNLLLFSKREQKERNTDIHLFAAILVVGDYFTLPCTPPEVVHQGLAWGSMPGQQVPRRDAEHLGSHDPEQLGPNQDASSVSGGVTDAEKVHKKKKKKESTWNLITIYFAWALPLIVLVPMVCVAAISVYLVGFEAIVEYVFDEGQRDQNKLLHILIINGLLVTSQILCVPAVLYVLANGFFFGFWEGLALNFLATIVGALGTLVVARGCLKSTVRKFIQNTPNLWEAFRICEEEPTGKFLVLFRLIIVIPGFVKNYTMALLEIPTTKFVICCIPDALFAGCFNSYVGHKAFVIGEKLRKEEEIAEVFTVFNESKGFIIAISLFFTGLLSYFGYKEYRRRKDGIAKGEEQPLVSGQASPDSSTKV